MTNKDQKKSQYNTNMFMNLFAILSALFVFGYITAITFMSIPKENQRYADTILGFLAGTLLSTIVNFYFGSSKSSKDKDTMLLNSVPADNATTTTQAPATTTTTTTGTTTPEVKDPCVDCDEKKKEEIKVEPEVKEEIKEEKKL
jgi:hypothetical protein